VLGHIEQCLAELDGSLHLAADADAVETALWFHDAVYAPGRPDNEARSAALAIRSLADAAVTPSRRDSIARLILATRHDAVPDDPDAQLIVDIDLAILGASPERFDEYERAIRLEYRQVPDSIFRKRRADVLQGLLARPRIYRTDSFHARYELPARDNLLRSIHSLDPPS